MSDIAQAKCQEITEYGNLFMFNTKHVNNTYTIRVMCYLNTIKHSGLSTVSDIMMHYYIDGLVQDCSNSIANALELLQSCIKSSACFVSNTMQHSDSLVDTICHILQKCITLIYL